MHGASPLRGSHRVHLSVADEIEPRELSGEPVLSVLAGAMGVVAHLSDGRRTITGLFLPGDYINLAALSRQISGTITALGPSTLQIIDQSVFDSLLEHSRQTREHFVSRSNALLFQMLDHSNDLAKKTPIERIAAFLFELRSRRDRNKSHELNHVQIPFGRRDIADYLGLQPETVSRGFTALAHEGAIKLLATDKIEILNMKGLRYIANGGRPRKKG
ncbi:Crp/Fnr family transcriptional regulator [Polycladidibacter hongkongensis]|uniref:Crp/Fnr family transcriptional regulator n=1 Tax=Polycladidibacter hongkongensis TaxID=1647556 RepID=UPI000AC59F9E|nr:helix-turn-helix domain-containing protein [Pseudovibrio hongkongensis]